MSTNQSGRRVGRAIFGLCLATAVAAIAVSNGAAPAQQGPGGGGSRAQPQAVGGAPGQAINSKDISLDQAHAVLAAAVEKAGQLNTKMDVAVVDAGGNLKAFVRMDGAWLGSIDISIRKARTARWFDMPTGEIGKLSQPGGPLYGIEHSNDGLITFPGGVPIKTGDGTIIGAIGVSGSTVENDHEVAAAGAGVIK